MQFILFNHWPIWMEWRSSRPFLELQMICYSMITGQQKVAFKPKKWRIRKWDSYYKNKILNFNFKKLSCFNMKMNINNIRHHIMV